jgi:uncharacterized protein VirK/YbjX
MTTTATPTQRLIREQPRFMDKLHHDFCARLWEAADDVQRLELLRASWFVIPTQAR